MTTCPRCGAEGVQREWDITSFADPHPRSLSEQPWCGECEDAFGRRQLADPEPYELWAMIDRWRVVA